MTKIFVINGPNLNLLGDREPEVYGTTTLKEIEQLCRDVAREAGAEVDFRQTNDEGTFIDWLHEARQSADAVVLNPAAFTHHSYAVAEAVSALDVPVVEVHLSNIYSREEWRRRSVVSPVATAVVAGLGARGYTVAVAAACELAEGKG
ncbi:MAG TPA: type II 3-dehydroquinate dehydratase [Actinomycetota bacterium]|nr:type II 3-dehydroquinate dehydratase [Actinomycetota bacterium]